MHGGSTIHDLAVVYESVGRLWFGCNAHVFIP